MASVEETDPPRSIPFVKLGGMLQMHAFTSVNAKDAGTNLVHGAGTDHKVSLSDDGG